MNYISPTPSTYMDLEIRMLDRQAEGYPVEITFSRTASPTAASHPEERESSARR